MTSDVGGDNSSNVIHKKNFVNKSNVILLNIMNMNVINMNNIKH